MANPSPFVLAQLTHDPQPPGSSNVVDRFMLRLGQQDAVQRILAPAERSRADLPADTAENADAITIAGLSRIEDACALDGVRPLDASPMAEDVACAARRKACPYRDAANGEWTCEAPHIDGAAGGTVLEAACRACDVPDERWACAHLRGAVVQLATLPDGTETRESVALGCALGNTPSECVPGGAHCWTRLVPVPAHHR